MSRPDPQAGRPRNIAVIGSGIVGMSAALHLLKDGHRVTVIDARSPGTATSYGNAGALVTGAIEPTSTPGVLKDIPRYLLDSSSAVRVRWSYMPKLAPWLARFLLESRMPRVRHAAASLHPLVTRALDAHKELIALTGAGDIVRPVGWLKVYRTERGFAGSALGRQLMDAHGVKYEVLSPDEIGQLEPGLARVFVKGLFHSESAFCTLPKKLIDAYAAYFFAGGGVWLPEAVRQIEPLADGQVRVRSELGIREFDTVVVASGAWSKPFAAQVGDRLQLDTERGYHLNIEPGAARELRRPVCLPEDKFVLAPMQDGIRLTSGEEFAGVEAAPDFSRIHKLLPTARAVLPGLSDRITREWMGRRPSTPDSLPVIGRSPNASQVIYAFGHQHLGLTLGPLTGRLVAQLVRGAAPEIDLAPYSIARF
jgi:D-amino-acid dehydrogenase